MLTNSVTQKFPKRCILAQATEFQSIFQTGKKIRTRHFTLYVKPNQLTHARLGLVVAKKVIRLAVKRNLVKRIIREGFRQQQNLAGFDIIVVVHPAINTLSRTELRNFLENQWIQL